jgi:hypothetical protein
MKRIIGGLCACACVSALVIPAGASAKAPHHPATLFFDGSSTIDDTLFVVGHLTSPSEKCLSKRTVKVLYDYDGFEPVDVAKSSNNGFFAGAGPALKGSSGVDAVKYKLLEKTYRKNGRKHVCEGDTLVVD